MQVMNYIFGTLDTQNRILNSLVKATRSQSLVNILLTGAAVGAACVASKVYTKQLQLESEIRLLREEAEENDMRCSFGTEGE